MKYLQCYENRCKANKKPDKRPMDFKNLDLKPKIKDFCQMFVIAIKKSRTLGKKTIG